MKRAAVVLVFAFCAVSHAEEVHSVTNQNKVDLNEVKPGKNKISDDKVDEILTNNLLRAQSGSKSKWSISNSITYNGGTIETPFNEHIPNISAGTGLTSVANLTDSISIKYRSSIQHAWSAGIGARWITPLNGSEVPNDYNGNKYDAYNPYARYQYVYRLAGIQNWFSTGPRIYTFNDLTRKGYVGDTIIQQSSVYEVGKTGLSLGALYYVDYAFYNDKSKPYENRISDYSGGFEPYLEYQMTQNLNLRTFWGLWVYEHIVGEPRALTFLHDTLTQSFGVGIKVIRDVFLYPNVTFIPYDIRADRTNVGMSANINLF